MQGSFRILVRRKPASRQRGVALIGGRAVPVTLGRSGVRADKREGDGATPRGIFHPVRIWWRADRGVRPRSALPIRRIGPASGWCEDPADRRYNRPVVLGRDDAGDRLWRDDRLYDLVVELDHNARPRVAHRGSAVFIHLARPDGGPTAGCVGFAPGELRRLLARLDRNTRIVIQ